MKIRRNYCYSGDEEVRYVQDYLLPQCEEFGSESCLINLLLIKVINETSEDDSMIMFEAQDVWYKIPLPIRNIVWYMAECLGDAGYIHHFALTSTLIEVKLHQRIVHSQVESGYIQDFSFECQEPVNISVTITLMVMIGL